MDDQFIYYQNLLRDEITQRSEEGCDVTTFFQRLTDALNLQELFTIYDQVSRLSTPLAVAEPSDLESILKTRPACPHLLSSSLSKDEILDQIHGGWLGRCAGCHHEAAP